MRAIIGGFETLLNNIQSAWQIVINLFSAIGKAFIYIQRVETTLIGIIGTIPSWLSGFMLATLMISIIYIIIGRVGGKSS